MTVQTIKKTLGISEDLIQLELDNLVDRRLIKTCMITDFISGRMVRAYKSPLADEDLIENE